MRDGLWRTALDRGPWILVLWLCLPLVGGEDELWADPPPSLRAGFASTDLTPTTPVPLAGYARRHGKLSTGVHDPVKARAAVFEQGTTRIALVSVDLVGVTRKVRDEVRAQLRDLELTELILAATHNHAGPGALTDIPLWRPMIGRFDPRLRKQAVERIAACVRAAAAGSIPIRLRTVVADGHDLVRNRRDPGGYLPRDISALAAVDEGGRVRGMLFHFAAHPTLLGADTMQISAGWPGMASAELERAHPRSTAVFLNGAMGDIAPELPQQSDLLDDDFDRARVYGQTIAHRIVRALQTSNASSARDPGLRATTREVGARTVFGKLLGGAQAGLASAEPWPLLTTEARIGPITLITVPGEPIAAFNRMVAGGPERWVVSCAQDHLGYFVDREAANRGGYEADMCFFEPLTLSHLAAGHASTPFWSWLRPPVRVEDRLVADGTPPYVLTPAQPHGEGLHHITPHLAGKEPVIKPGWALGAQHGRSLRAPIRDLLEAAQVEIEKQVLSKGAALLLAPLAQQMGVDARELVVPMLVRAARRLQKHIPDEYINEMEGVASGAGVPFDAILLENTFLTLAEQTDPTALLQLPARCTNVVALGESTSMGQLVHASTLDWGMAAVLRDRTVVLVMEPRDGHPFVSITWPGMVGTLRAMGAQGISITEESCAAADDTRLEGLPVNLLMRKVVQYGETLEDSVAMVRQAPGTCGYKLTVASGHALDARVVEVTATKSHVRRPEAGLLFGCAPGAPQTAFVGSRDLDIPADDASSARRYPAIARLLTQARGSLRTELVSWALSASAGGVLNEGTLLACVFEPQLGRFHVALGDDIDVEGGELHWRSQELLGLLSADRRRAYALPPQVEEVGTFSVRRLPVPLKGVTVKELEFPSPIPCGLAQCDQVKAQLYLPENPIGVVIELPAWKENTLVAHRMLAIALSRKRIATVVMPLPGQAWRRPRGVRSGVLTLSENLAQTRRAFIQGLADIKRLSLWLETQGFPPERQAVAGVSLGGHAAALAFGSYPDRFKAGVFMLTGANVHEAFLNWNPVTSRIHERLTARGVTPEEAALYVMAFDPANTAVPDRPGDVLLIAANKDRVVPPKNATALAKAFGGAKIYWLEGDHYAILAGMGNVIREMSEHLTTAFGAK